MSFLAFVIIVALLSAGGYLLSALILPARSRLLHLSLALPISAFTNVLIVLIFTTLSIPLSSITVIIAHAVIIGIAIGYKRWTGRSPLTEAEVRNLRVNESLFTRERWRSSAAIIISTILISITAIYAFSHAVLLPTFQYDSATNWTMRSRISFEDQHMAFDATEDRGMAKPQYPFLFHALQVTANQLSGEWSDTKANAILLLVSLSSFGALFVLIKRSKGTVHAVIGIGLILTIPLISIHTAQGYGDLNLLQYFLLSLACLGMMIAEADRILQRRWMILSAIFVAASVYTKSEGMFFGLLPWLVTIAAIFGYQRMAAWKKELIIGSLTAVILSAPWILFALIKGMGFTPHQTDTTFALQKDAAELIPALFDRGSFGIVWYLLPIAIICVLWMAYKRDQHVVRPQVMLLVWGVIMFLETLIVYAFTPNIQFLLNTQAFYRQMMIPGSMLILSLAMVVVTNGMDKTQDMGHKR